MKAFYIKQGDAYSIPVKLTLNGEEILPENVELVEFMLGSRIRRVYPDEVSCDDGAFYFPLTQAETLGLAAGLTLPLDVRVKFAGGNVIGTLRAAQVTVADAVSGKEL